MYCNIVSRPFDQFVKAHLSRLQRCLEYNPTYVDSPLPEAVRKTRTMDCRTESLFPYPRSKTSQRSYS